MKFRDPISWGVGFGASILATTLLLPQAYGEMVYYDQVQTGQTQPVNVAPAMAPGVDQNARVSEREGMREVLGVSHRAQTSAEAPRVIHAVEAPAAVVPVVQTQAVIAAPVAQAAAVVPVGPPTTVEVQNLSKSELMRRERVRTELKNEDILQERLEELRLREERRRSDQLLGIAPSGPEAVVTAPAGHIVKEEVVVAPVNERRPGDVASAGAFAGAGVHHDGLGVSSAHAVSAADDKLGDKFQLFVQPKGGLTNIYATGFNTRPRFSGGLALGAAVSDNVSLELGYSYSENGITMALSNPALAYIDYWRNLYSGYNPNLETHTYKQNTFDVGMKLHLLGMDSRIRPFIGGGGGYGKSFVNFEQRFLDYYRSYPSFTSDYEVSQFLGYVTGGLDVRVSRSVSVGATFRYYAVLSSRENHTLDNRPFLGYAPYGAYSPYGYTDADKQYLGSSLARTNFYSILAGASFTF